MLGEAFALMLAGSGVIIERENESQESYELYISVPEHSYELDAHGNEMAGMRLAKRIKEMMTELGVKRLTVKARVRIGEYWTKEMDREATLKMKKMIYGSQY